MVDNLAEEQIHRNCYLVDRILGDMILVDKKVVGKKVVDMVLARELRLALFPYK